MEIPPIQTDDGIQLKSMAKATLWNTILWLVLAIQQFFMLRQTVIDLMTGKHWYQFAETVSSSFRLGLGVFQIVFISLCVCAILRFLVFFMRNIIRIRPGRGMWYYGYRSTTWFYRFYVGLLLILVVMLVVINLEMPMMLMVAMIGSLIFMFLIAALLSWLIKRRWANRWTNVAVTVAVCVVCVVVVSGAVIAGVWRFLRDGGQVVYEDVIYSYTTDELTIYLDELGYEKEDYDVLYEETYAEGQSSCFASYREYSDYYVLVDEEESVGYAVTIFSSQFPWVLDRFNQLLLEADGFTTTEKPEWAQELWKDGTVCQVVNAYTEKLLVMKESVTIVLEGGSVRAGSGEAENSVWTLMRRLEMDGRQNM